MMSSGVSLLSLDNSTSLEKQSTIKSSSIQTNQCQLFAMGDNVRKRTTWVQHSKNGFAFRAVLKFLCKMSCKYWQPNRLSGSSPALCNTKVTIM